MMPHTTRAWWTLILVTAAVTGLVSPPRLLAADKEEVEKAFKAFQAALKAKDAAKIFALLDSASQKAAARAAQFVKTNYNKAAPAQKAKMVKTLGLSGADLAKLTGEGFLKTTTFQGKYDEVLGSKIQEVAIQDDRATVTYIEEDGDKEKLRLNREKGKWKISAPMPTVPKS